MKIAVKGLWHLGSVTAACLAEAGFNVVGIDADPVCINELNEGHPPIFEPGLQELIEKHLHKGLFFSTDVSLALDADLVWVTYDTPVDDNDVADVKFVEGEIEKLFPHLKENAVVLISSQVPVGTTGKLAAKFNRVSDKNISFCYSPENLRLGNAINVFSKADRIIAGINEEADKKILDPVFSKFTPKIVWMSVPSAEMTKHAINAFLATSVVFINELAVLCEHVGADAAEVEAGLKSESRIGPKAYLKPGTSFAGGTLARDIAFLVDNGNAFNLPSYLFNSVRKSNDHHKSWIYDKLCHLFGSIQGKNISILGLTYKAGTNTLRRSGAVELCKKIADDGAMVKAYDPALKTLPEELAGIISYPGNLQETITGADAIVVCTEWPDFKAPAQQELLVASKVPYVIDPNNFLQYLHSEKSIHHIIIGKSL